MADPLDAALADLDEQLGVTQPPAADAGTEETETPEVAAPEAEAESGQPRDEHGRFTTDEDTSDEESELILGRFKTHDDLQKAYQELESEFGRRNADWQELKQLREEINQVPQQVQESFRQQQYAAQGPALVQQFVDMGEYRKAAEYAKHIPDQGYTYQQVLGAWRGDDPDRADFYEQQQVMAYQHQQLQTAVAEQQLQNAYQEFARTRPDLGEVAGEMVSVAQESPRILALLQEPDPQARMDVLDYLYTKAKLRVQAGVSDATQQAQTELQAETDALKRQAHVGTQTRTVPAETKSEGEQWLEEMGFDEAAATFYGRDEAA